MRPVTIAAVQMGLKEADITGNTVRALELLERAGGRGADLAVLPEMWWTGFSFRKLPAFADQTPASLAAVGEVARRCRMAVIGSWPEKEGGRVFNTAYVVGADGEVCASYRKVHLFRPMKEDLFLSPGNSLTTVDLPFGKVGIAICYDLRFPELVRKLALAGAEVIAVPSQWPDVRIEHFWTLLRARAIENQLFVVGANRTGWGGKLRFGGYSALIGPGGETHAEGGGEDGLACAEVDLDEVSERRREMCHLDDRVPGVDD